MKMKRSDLLALWQAFEELQNNKQEVLFSYFIAKNRIAMRDAVNEFNKKQELTEEFKKYDVKRSALASAYADKNEKNEPVINNGEYVITQRKPEFDKKLAGLKNTFSSVIEEWKKQIDMLNNMLKEEVEIPGYKIKLVDIPHTIEPRLIELILVNHLLIVEDASV